MWKVHVEKEKCSGCSECVDNCPGEVYELRESKATPTNIDACHGCFTCIDLCDEKAITVEDD